MEATTAHLRTALVAVLLGYAFAASITDLPTRAASQILSAGETLVFEHLPNHDVLEASKAGGSATVPLTKRGSKRWFIGGTAGRGLKLELDVSAAAAAGPAADAPSPVDSPFADGPTAEDSPTADAPGAADLPAADAPGAADAPPADHAPSAKNTTSPSTKGSTLVQRVGSPAVPGVKVSVATNFASGLLVLLIAL